jgi:hypothetical protein
LNDLFAVPAQAPHGQNPKLGSGTPDDAAAGATGPCVAYWQPSLFSALR